MVDDDQDILDIVSMILTEDGYEVRTLSTGEQIFATINRFIPDLVLMDVMLASMDGRLICKDLKQHTETRHIPVILISGTHDLANTLNKHGAPNDFIAKPFDIQTLLDKIKMHVL